MMPTPKTLLTSDHKKARRAIAIFRAQYDNAGLDADSAQRLNESKPFATDLLALIKRHSATQPSFSDAEKWVYFYRRYFGKDADLTDLHVPQKPDYLCWPIVIVPSLITNNEAFEACKKTFGAWRYTNDLNICDIVARPTGPYVVWAKQNIEADHDLANVSANEIEKRKVNTLTLRERLILELSYFDETKQHLDIDNRTLCAGSRGADGYVPGVDWRSISRELFVGWYDADVSYDGLRARAAVS
jgi:hypothetical protein